MIETAGLVGLISKSAWSDLSRIRHIEYAMQAAAGIPTPQPVYWGPEASVIGIVWGNGYFDRESFYLPTDPMSPDRFWATFATYDSIINAITLGQRLPISWSKNHSTAPTANRWHDLWPVAGYPSSGTYVGTASTALAYTDQTVGAAYHGGNVSAATKHLLYGMACSTGGTPMTMLYDRVLGYEANAFNANVATTMTNVATAARYNGAGQSGMQILTTVQTTITVTTALNALIYINQAGTAGRTVLTTPSIYVGAGVTPTTTLGAQVISPVDSGNTVLSGPFLPLQAGDGGVRSITSYTTALASAGTFALVLARPLGMLPTAQAGVASEKDFVQMVANLERVYDGACLSMMAYFPAATGTTIFGQVDVGWA